MTDPRSLYTDVLLAADGSELADRAMAAAHVVSAALGADLHVLGVAPGESERADLRTHIEQALAARGATAQVEVEIGDQPAEAISAAADALGDPLVCMGTHGRGRSSAVLGSVAAQVLRRRGAPIFVAGPECAEKAVLEPYRLVACLDGGPDAEQVLPVAARWADAFGMDLSLITVAEPTPDPVRPESTGFRRHGPDHPEAYLTEAAGRVERVSGEVTTHVVYDPIAPADGVAAHLREAPATLVAISSHARSGLQMAMLGSDASRIVRHAPVPVLVVPHHAVGGSEE